MTFSHSVQIRTATEKDAPAMRSVALENYVPPEDLQAHSHVGFTAWPRPTDAYLESIRRSSHVIVAEVGGHIIGHLMAYPLDVFYDLEPLMPCESNVTAYFKETYDPQTIFIDQISIHQDYRRHGIGRQMDQYLIENTPHHNFWVTDIITAPVTNHASESFFTSRHFLKTSEIPQDEWILGIYERGEHPAPTIERTGV